jgi:hypothetical protein
MVVGQSVCGWMYIQHALHIKFLEQRNTFLKFFPALGRSQITSGLRVSDTKLEGQMGRTSGSYFGVLGLKPRPAVRSSWLSRIRVRPVWPDFLHPPGRSGQTASIHQGGLARLSPSTRAVWPDCLHSRSSNYAETAWLNKPLNVRSSYSLVACDAVHIRSRPGVSLY